MFRIKITGAILFFKTSLVFILLFYNTTFVRAQQEKINQAQHDTLLIHQLKKHVYFLASDGLKGRKAGSEEFNQACIYAENILSNQGLMPFFGNSFRQPVTFLEKRYGQTMAMKILFNDKVSDIPPGKIKYFNLINDRLFQHHYPLLYFNLGNLDPKKSFATQSTVNWKNKILVVSAGKGKDHKAEPVNVTLSKISGITESDNKPAGIILLTNARFDTIWPRIHSMISSSGYEPGIKVPKRLRFFNTDLILLKAEVAGLFCKEIEESGHNTASVTPGNPFQFAKTSIQYSIPSTQTKYHSWNLGGYIPGSDSVLKDEFIVVGAHLDHLGVVDGKIMNGADDNASGSAAILELVHQLKNTRPKRSIALILWTAEECEAMGSQQFFPQSPIAREQIKWYINFDMIGRTATENSESGALYVSSFPEWMTEEQKTFQNCSLNKPRFVFTTKGLSDHFVFELYQIPNFGFYSGHHKDVHQPTDDADKLNYGQMADLVVAARKIILHLADKED
ncbi:MAG: M20/M25/M40 family metallo-hydrolase [Bacteroidales bacterium]|nr:M20/M25/M40 family metallo-hydrolase [Bacteroidales bacterium]